LSLEPDATAVGEKATAIHLTHLVSRRRNAALAEEFDPSQHSTSKEDTMAVQIVMDQSGDMRHQFDPADARAVAQAEARFKELTGAGFAARRVQTRPPRLPVSGNRVGRRSHHHAAASPRWAPLVSAAETER